MKIVILDGYTENPGDLGWGGFEALGELMVYDRTPENQVIERIGDAELVITSKTLLTADTPRKCESTRYIGVLATGHNVVNVQAARERNIPVTNIPTYGTKTVVQFAIAPLLGLCHHVGEHSDAVKHGDWTNSIDWCFWNHPLIELDGKTMGIIGFGKIGQSTAQIARALGMKVLTNDTYHILGLESETLRYTKLDELLAELDVVVLHCPLFPSTQGIINKNTIVKMKPGAMIINNSHGPLIMEQDLADALNPDKVASAARGVVSTEPVQVDNPLLTAKNVILTPHITWAPKESRQRLIDIAVENLKAFLNGSPVNVVNL